MRRTIKFRAWDKVCNSMLMPDEIHLYMNGTVSVNQVWATGDLELMQYTGLKDKHGKEIYESDVVRILYTDWPSGDYSNISVDEYKKSISKIGAVVWDNRFNEAHYVIDFGEDYQDSINPGTHGEIEVIGNIYEN